MMMPFGSSVTSYLADLIPNDPVAPQVIGDFAQALPPNPIRGPAVSDFAHAVIPGGPPISPADVGAQLSDYIALLHEIGGGDGGGLGDGGLFG